MENVPNLVNEIWPFMTGNNEDKTSFIPYFVDACRYPNNPQKAQLFLYVVNSERSFEESFKILSVVASYIEKRFEARETPTDKTSALYDAVQKRRAALVRSIAKNRDFYYRKQLWELNR